MKKPLPKVTESQKFIVFGYVLGDGYLYKDGRLQVEQGEAQEEFVRWLYKELESLASGEVKKQRKSRKATKTAPASIGFSYRFYTKKLFANLVSLFYTQAKEKEKRSKILPANLEEFFNPTALAVWFLCDGTKYISGQKSVYINASSLSNQEQIQIQQALLNVFGLIVNIHLAGKSETGNQQYNFYVTADSYDKFHDLVYPTVSQVPSMLYKLHERK